MKTLNFKLQLCILNFAFLIILLLPHFAEAGLIIKAPPYIGLQEGLVGFWSFDGPDMFSTKATDRSGQGNNGTLTNGPKRAIGRIGQALEFDGVDDYVNVSDSSSLDITGAVTVTAWFKPDTIGDTDTIVSKRSAWSATGIPYELSITGQFNRIQWRVVGNTNDLSSPDNEVVVGEWHFVSGTWDGTTQRIYKNGIEIVNASNTNTITSNNSSVRIGELPDGSGELFDGHIDEVRIYNRALSADEIRRVYNMGR